MPVDLLWNGSCSAGEQPIFLLVGGVLKRLSSEGGSSVSIFNVDLKNADVGGNEVHGVRAAYLLTHESAPSSIIWASENSIFFGTISGNVETVTREIPLGTTGRHLLHDDISNTVMVVCPQSSSDLAYGLRERPQKSFAALRFVNLANVELLQPVEAVCSKSKQPIFSSDEYPICAAKWVLDHNNKQYRYFCIGTKIFKHSGSQEGWSGRVRIITYELVSNEVVMRNLNKITLTDPVHAVQPIGQHSLAVASANKLEIRRLDIDERRFNPAVERAFLPSPAVSMFTDPLKINGPEYAITVLTESNGSVSFLYDEEAIRMGIYDEWSSTFLAASGSALRTAQSPSSLLSDKLGNLMQYRTAYGPLIWTRLSTIITKMRPVVSQNDISKPEADGTLIIGVDGSIRLITAIGTDTFATLVGTTLEKYDRTRESTSDLATGPNLYRRYLADHIRNEDFVNMEALRCLQRLL